MPTVTESPGDIAQVNGPIAHAIYRISRMSRTTLAGLLRSSGVFPGQELLLMQLFEQDGLSQTDLVRALGLDASTVTKMLQRMERAGWVERTPADHDHRVVLITLTDKGRSLQAVVEDAWRSLERLTTECLDNAQIEQARAVLAQIEEHMSARSARTSDGSGHLRAVRAHAFTD
ncbi:MAG: MarR family winged helix-turn-helix transcriptional regulator [Acidimicrobiales bacterium]